MAKTRSQSKADSAKKSSFDFKISKTSNQIKKTNRQTSQVSIPRIVECFVRLTKLDKNVIANLTAPRKLIDDQPKNVRVLRERKSPQLTIKPKKNLSQIVAISKAALHTSKAMRVWEQLKKQNSKEKLVINQMVLARMSGHRPWPAKVTQFKKNGLCLFFFGTSEIGVVKRAEIIPLILCKEVIEEYLKISVSQLSSKSLSYHMQFVKACKEISCA